MAGLLEALAATGVLGALIGCAVLAVLALVLAVYEAVTGAGRRRRYLRYVRGVCFQVEREVSPFYPRQTADAPPD